MSEEAYILEFCRQWLPAWTGNDPDKLLQFYTSNAFYSDPANPEGLQGHQQLNEYFTKLLAANPNWVWEPVEVFPTLKGFNVKWRAVIPIGKKKIVEFGMDIVEVEDGRISRNEVYFDRSRWLESLPQRKKK
ncbi:MAG: nuclear transport factor 2 family protein [Candidatus Hermodarchaeota archaeon]|nr:nuclear transport factor 2 family protein [Candidatus Hermodarchaeota archaeon]